MYNNNKVIQPTKDKERNARFVTAKIRNLLFMLATQTVCYRSFFCYVSDDSNTTPSHCYDCRFWQLSVNPRLACGVNIGRKNLNFFWLWSINELGHRLALQKNTMNE